MPARLLPPGGHQEWAHFDDEQLVELAQQAAGSSAQGELLRRFNAPIGRLVRRLAVRSGFQQADCMDVQQEAVFWTLEAIRHFRTGDRALTHGCRFRTFLHRVVSARFIDYFRRQRHRERLIGLEGRLGTGVAGVRSADPPGSPHGDPAALDGPEWSDVRVCLEQELDRLGGAARDLWRLLVQGVALRRAALELGISYDTAKRERRHILARLRVVLTG